MRNNLPANKPVDETISYSNRQLFKDLAAFIHPYRWRFLSASSLRLTSDLAALYPSYAFALIITFLSKYRPGESLGYLWMIIGSWAVINSIKHIARALSKNYDYQVAEKISLDAQSRTLKHLFSLDILWHEKENAGNKLKRVQKGGEGLEKIVRIWINNAIEIAVNFIGMIFILWRIDSRIGFIMLVFLVTYFIFSFFFLRKAKDTAILVSAKEEDMLGLIFQAINNIRSVKVSGLSANMLKIIAAKVEDIFSTIKKRILYFQVRGGVLDIWSLLFRLATMVVIVFGIVQGHYEVGVLILFNGYFNSLIASVAELSDISQEIIVQKISIARMMAILGEPVIIDDDRGKKDFPDGWKKISVRDLSFSYGSHKVLDRISFDINRGERIGIVGLSGVGKSTLFKLLLKEIENYDGEIKVDNVSLKDIRKDSYYAKAGVVLQETEVFNFSLADNITIAGSPKHKAQSLNEAIATAHVNKFLYKLPEGIDTLIGEKGVKLSGGEKQRLGIARAIYKKPDLLFLDEATSHLDLESEEKIRDSLEKFFQQVTAVVIAHRLTTIKNMDRIIMMEKGKIIESGYFNELMEKKGKFYQLWERQKL